VGERRARARRREGAEMVNVGVWEEPEMRLGYLISVLYGVAIRTGCHAAPDTLQQMSLPSEPAPVEAAEHGISGRSSLHRSLHTLRPTVNRLQTSAAHVVSSSKVSAPCTSLPTGSLYFRILKPCGCEEDSKSYAISHR
jgi:hypothetical protein